MTDDEESSPAQGVNEIIRAAVDAVADHLDRYPESFAANDLWENHPLLVEHEADKAVIQAELIADALRDLLRLLAPADPAIYRKDD